MRYKGIIQLYRGGEYLPKHLISLAKAQNQISRLRGDYERPFKMIMNHPKKGHLLLNA